MVLCWLWSSCSKGNCVKFYKICEAAKVAVPHRDTSLIQTVILSKSSWESWKLSQGVGCGVQVLGFFLLWFFFSFLRQNNAIPVYRTALLFCHVGCCFFSCDRFFSQLVSSFRGLIPVMPIWHSNGEIFSWKIPLIWSEWVNEWKKMLPSCQIVSFSVVLLPYQR